MREISDLQMKGYGESVKQNGHRGHPFRKYASTLINEKPGTL